MAGVGTILEGIYRRSGLHPPRNASDLGVPLFAYRIQPNERQALERALRTQLPPSGRLDSTLAAGFCLYGASTICGDYAGGPWAWELVLQRLPWVPTEMELQAAVRLGLQVWRRPLVHISSTRYLSTLVCEGGLPLGLLSAGRERALKIFFRELIRDVERYRVPCDAVIDRRSHTLPASLRNDTVLQLSAQLVDAIVAVRREIPSGVSAGEYVDRNLDELGRTLPLQLENSILQELVKGLVAVPAPRAGERTLIIELKTTFRSDGVVRFERVAFAPPTASVEALAGLLGLDSAVLLDNPRINLELLTEDGARRSVAVARLRQGEPEFALDRSLARPVIRMPALAGRILLTATVGGRQLALVEPPGGAALDLEAPWAIDGAPDRDAHPILAFGSHRTASGHLLVAVPRDMQLAPGDGAVLERRYHESALDRDVYDLVGSLTCQGLSGEWRFETRAEPDPEITYTLSGRLDRAGFAGTEYWVGWPQVYAIDENGIRRAVAPERIESRTTSSKVNPWRQVYGDQCLVIRDDGGVRYRARVVVMPSDLRIRLRAGERCGEIEVTSRELKAASATTPAGRVHGVVGPQGITLRLESTASPGDEVEIHFLFRDGGEATLRAPMPIHAAGFVGGDGCPPTAPVSIESLISIRARVVSPDEGGWVLECRLPASTPWMSLQELPSTLPSVHELSLHAVRDRIAELFGLTDELDALVELRIAPRTGTVSRTASILRVRRYDAKLTLRRHGSGVELGLDAESVASLGAMGCALLRLEARPLAAPADSAVEIPSTEVGAWSLDTTSMLPGPWLILGRIHGALRLRPLLIPVAGELTGPTDELEHAVREADPKLRLVAVRRALATSASAWNTPEGQRLRQFLGTLGDLPAVTFDAVKALASQPDAATLALLQTPPDRIPAVWDGLEELAFLWSTVPLSSWVRAGRRLHKWAEAQRASLAETSLTPASLIGLTLQGFVERGTDRSPLVPLVHELLYLTVPHIPAPINRPTLRLAQTQHGRSALHAALLAQAGSLCERHESDWWPTDVVTNATGLSAEVGWTAADSLLPRIGAQHHQPVMRAPVVAALAAFHEKALPRQTLVDLRRLRAFDPVWFDLGHVFALGMLLGERLQVDKGYLDDA